jgi:hypothetical protein
MTQKYPKRLIEVDLPIKRISAHARREKSIRHGHISTLHIWWARRPLAACRAVICASLWPDPADPLCPQSFRDRASKIIYDFAAAAVHSKELGASCDHETWIKWQAMARNGTLDSHKEAHWNILRFALLDFIADFANWDTFGDESQQRASRLYRPCLTLTHRFLKLAISTVRSRKIGAGFPSPKGSNSASCSSNRLPAVASTSSPSSWIRLRRSSLSPST